MGFYQNDDQLAEKVRPGVTQLRVIIGAFLAGVTIFLGIATAGFVVVDPPPPNDMTIVLLAVTVCGAVLVFAASLVLARIYVRHSRGQLVAGTLTGPVHHTNGGGHARAAPGLDNAGKMFTVYQTQAILAGAMREGAAFFSIVMFFITGSWIAIGVAVLLIATIATLWPSPQRVAGWIHEQFRLADTEKLLGGNGV